jgi:hypothetical protein
MNDKEMLLLQNDFLQVRMLPAFGGKITSLLSLQTGEEFLLPPLKAYHRVSSMADFSESDGGGFDECLPSVASCDGFGGKLPVADHGDLWRLAWDVESQDSTIVLRADAVSRPLRLTRRASLEGSKLILDYELLNLSDSPTTWLWSAHPLLCVDAGDRIVLPDEVEQVVVEYSAGDFFSRNSSISWPIAQSTLGTPVDLSTVGGRDGVTAHKRFARMGRCGWGAHYRQRSGQGLVVRFDPSALPFMGVWICSGAWPERGAEKQYTVALEPTTSNADSLATAEHDGMARFLEGREECRWRLELQVIGVSSPVSFEDFCSAVKL